MRIALFSDVYIPAVSGVATSIELLRNELIKRGHEVFVYTVKDPDALVDDDNIIRIPSLPFISSKRLALNLSPLSYRQIRKQEFDIIHTQTEFGLGVLGRSIAKKDNIPFVHTFHTIYEDFTRDMLAKWPRLIDDGIASSVRSVSRRFCNSADQVIVPTEKAAILLKEYGVTKPMHIIPTGLDLERFKSAAHDEKKRLEFRSRLGLKPEDKVLLYLGRVSNEKHIDELLDYLFRLFPEITGLKLVITGEGAAYNRLVKRVKSANQVENVIFTGPVPLSEVPHYYAMADIFTSASQSETQGLTYIEAQASGLPLLVRKDPALDKVITDGSNGYYFTDEESFAANLRQLLSRLRQNREEIFQLSLATAARFGVCKFATRVLDVYGQAISDQGKSIE
ncbi:MAG: glycosyltransferase family 4 protein [Clostridiales bacterium]|nr:glycosyltransferase family 4 protein [Clostridiales bacterium]